MIIDCPKGSHILDFHASGAEVLAYTRGGHLTHVSSADIAESSPDGSACYAFASLRNGGSVQLLLKSREMREKFPEAFDAAGNLTESGAEAMAKAIVRDGLLPARVREAQHAAESWKQAEDEERKRAAARAEAVVDVVQLCDGSKTAAAHLLGLHPSTVSKLYRKYVLTISADVMKMAGRGEVGWTQLRDAIKTTKPSVK